MVIDEQKLFEGIARGLWATYETNLPDTPQRMARTIINFMQLKGFVNNA